MMEQSAPGTIIDGIAAYLDQKLERFSGSLEEALATGDADAIHGLRVASRRLHEPLTLLAEWVRPRDLKAAKRGLARLRGAFREVRDLDVLLHSVIAAASGNSAGPRLAELEARLSARRAEAFEAAARRSRKLKPQHTIEALRGIRREIAGAGVHDESIRRRVDERIGALAGALIKCDPRCAEGDLHPARIHAKRLRYCAELAGHAGALPTGPLFEALTAMQDLLGHWNDDVTAARWLARLGRRRRVLTRDAAWSAELLQQAADRARSAEAQRGHVLQEWAGLDAHLQLWHRKPPELEPSPPSPAEGFTFLPEECGADVVNTVLVVEPLERERVEEDVEHV